MSNRTIESRVAALEQWRWEMTQGQAPAVRTFPTTFVAPPPAEPGKCATCGYGSQYHQLAPPRGHAFVAPPPAESGEPKSTVTDWYGPARCAACGHRQHDGRCPQQLVGSTTEKPIVQCECVSSVASPPPSGWVCGCGGGHTTARECHRAMPGVVEEESGERVRLARPGEIAHYSPTQNSPELLARLADEAEAEVATLRAQLAERVDLYEKALRKIATVHAERAAALAREQRLREALVFMRNYVLDMRAAAEVDRRYPARALSQLALDRIAAALAPEVKP